MLVVREVVIPVYLGWVGDLVRLQQSRSGWSSLIYTTGTANYPYLDAPIDAIKRKVANVTYYSSDSFPLGLTASPNDIAVVFINSDSGENSITVEGNDGDRSSSGLYAWHN